MNDLNKTDELILFCRERKSFLQIKNTFQWADGVTYNILRQLIMRNLMEHPEKGVYVSTKEGIGHINAKIKSIEESREKPHGGSSRKAKLAAIYLLDQKEIGGKYDKFLPMTLPTAISSKSGDSLTKLASVLDDIYLKVTITEYPNLDVRNSHAVELMTEAIWLNFSKNKSNKIRASDSFLHVTVKSDYLTTISDICKIKFDSESVFHVMWFFNLSVFERIKNRNHKNTLTIHTITSN